MRLIWIALCFMAFSAHADTTFNSAYGDYQGSDHVGGALYPKVKVVTGADGVATPVSAANPLPISGAITAGGKAFVTSVRNDYTGVNVTAGAWVQLIASTAGVATEISLFDSSGQTLELGTGAAAAETRVAIIFPGGNGAVPLAIPAGTRISVRAISATANLGELDINFFN